MTHIPNGLDFTIFQIKDEPATRPLSLLSAYHTAEGKGLSDALVALEAYHSRFPDVPIAMFGTRPLAEGLPAWIDYHGGLTGAGPWRRSTTATVSSPALAGPRAGP